MQLCAMLTGTCSSARNSENAFGGMYVYSAMKHNDREVLFHKSLGMTKKSKSSPDLRALKRHLSGDAFGSQRDFDHDDADEMSSRKADDDNKLTAKTLAGSEAGHKAGAVIGTTEVDEVVVDVVDADEAKRSEKVATTFTASDI